MRRTVWITTLMLLLAANVSVFGGEGQDETAQGNLSGSCCPRTSAPHSARRIRCCGWRHPSL